MIQHAPLLSEFEAWVSLARSDPAAFERLRQAMIEKSIAEAPMARQGHLRALQWRIDQERVRSKSALGACIRISRMMWEKVILHDGLVEQLRRMRASGGSDAAPIGRARIIPFPVPPSGAFGAGSSTYQEPALMRFPTIEDCIGNTPLIRLQRLPEGSGNTLLVKLEGHNPAGSVKDRPALSMIRHAEARGEIAPGDTLIEATSGNTGIALAMAAAIKGYRMLLVMPENMSLERRALMRSFGAQLELTPQAGSMEGAIDRARELEAQGVGKILDQFANPDNPRAHLEGTGPEIWRDTQGQVSHFVSSMGTTGTIMGVSQYLKAQNPAIQIIGVQPAEGSSIPGIRRWPAAYLPRIYDPSRVDRIIDVTQEAAEHTTRALASREGIFAGISSGGAVAAALSLSREVADAVIVCIVCDRGEKYLSTGVFPA